MLISCPLQIYKSCRFLPSKCYVSGPSSKLDVDGNKTRRLPKGPEESCCGSQLGSCMPDVLLYTACPGISMVCCIARICLCAPNQAPTYCFKLKSGDAHS